MADGTLIFKTKIDTSGADVGVEKLKANLSRATDNVKRTTAAVQKLEEELRGLQQEANTRQSSGSVVGEELSQKIYDTNAKLDTARAKLQQYEAVAEQTGIKLNEALDPAKPAIFANATKAASKKMEMLKNMFDRMIMRAAILAVAYKAITAIKDYFAEAFKQNPQYVKSIGQLKAALATMAQPLVNTILPALTRIAQVLTYIITLFTKLFTGSNYEKYRNQAEALNEQTSAVKGLGKAAKKTAGSLANFDEINTISTDTGSSSGGSSDAIAADFSAFETGVESELAKIALLVGGAALALGAILAFSGVNIPLGIGMMAIGAGILYAEAKMNWNSLSGPVKTAITSLLVVTGVMLLAFGAIFAFSGANVPLGIGLMIAGAASLAAAASLNWDSLTNDVSNTLGTILSIIGAFLIVLGVILMLSGVAAPLGAGLILAGVAVLGVGSIALNWDTITKDTRSAFGKILQIIGGMLIVLGVIMLLTGAALPLGIGLILAGIGILGVGTAVLNWNTVKNKIGTVCADILAIISGSLIVVGIILLLSGAGIGLGLALIAAGCAGSYAAWKIDDNPITRFVKQMANCVIGLVNSVIEAINDMFHISFNGLKIAGKEVIPAFNKRLVNIPRIPRLAEGGVIPPNREFMAILGDQKQGTNIEAPLDTIVEAFRRVSGNQEVTITFEGTMAQFVRQLRPVIKQVDKSFD